MTKLHKYIYLKKIRNLPHSDWLAGLKRDIVTWDWCDALPKMPDESFQKRFVGQAHGPAMQQAFDAIELFKHHIERLDGRFSLNDFVLDFGCGWGRISQALYRYFIPTSIISADIQAEAVDFCRRSELLTHIIQVENGNLAQIPDGSLQHIFAFSVFSHLSEKLAQNWIKEFYRILCPGGFIALTTRTLSILRSVQNLEKLPINEIPAHARGVIEAFKNSNQAIEDFNNGCFVFREYPHITKAGEGYGEAIIPESYVRNHWQPLFGGSFAFIPESGTVDQATIVIRKL